MSNQIIIVTNPDEVLADGFRILTMDLSSAQSLMVSTALSQLKSTSLIVIYVWNTGDDVDWLLDKKQKSSMILFNADSTNDLIVGYLAAQPSSYYYGTLKSLSKTNTKAIYDVTQTLHLLENFIENYEQRI